MKMQKLPDAEWKFDALANDVARGVFLYEFFRHSPKLRRLVRSHRKKFKAPVAGWEKVKFNLLAPKERQIICQQMNGCEAFVDLVQALVNCRAFPRTPALKILKKDNPNDWQKDWVVHWFCDLNPANALRYCSGITDGKDMKHAMRQAWGDPGIDYRFKGRIQAKEFESIFPVTIDWRKPDAQIMEAFRDLVLNRRPEQFREFTKISPAQVAFGTLFDKLPFKPVSALIWLGVLRRRNAVKTWRKYFELWNAAALQNVKNGVVKSRDISNFARPREEDCRKARLILDWFEKGTPLEKEDFK